MILEVEVREAHEHWLGCIGALMCLGFFDAAASVELLGGDVRAIGPLLVSLTATAGCFVWMRRCRKTIRAWRDQKRLELAQEEAEELSGPRLRPVTGGRG